MCISLRLYTVFPYSSLSPPDVVIDLLKLANYLKLEGLRGGFLVEIFFLTNFFTWAYTRLYIYPKQVMWLGEEEEESNKRSDGREERPR